MVGNGWRKCWLPAFSPFPTMFLKGPFLRDVKITGLCDKELTICHTILSFNNPKEEPFPKQALFLCVCSTSLLKKKTGGKGEIAYTEQFLLFPQCLLPVLRTFCHFHPL